MPRNFTYFGVDTIAFFQFNGGNHIGTLEIPGAIAIPSTVVEHALSQGGKAQLPAAARPQRMSGEMSVTVRECPAWLKAMCLGSTVVTAASSATPTVGPINDISGALSASLRVTTAADAEPGFVTVLMTAEAVATVTVRQANGAENSYPNVSVTTTARAVASTGISISRLASGVNNPVFAAGQSSDFFILPAAPGGTNTVGLPVNPKPKYVRILAYSADGGEDDFVQVIELYKALPKGIPLGVTDNEATADMELPFTLVDPQRTDGNWGSLSELRKA